MIRRELREHIFKMLFQIEFNKRKEMPNRILLYFETLPEASEEDKEYIKSKCESIIRTVGEIDRLLNEKTTGWKTARMNKVDLTILRLAVYEMKFDDDVPQGVAINEAVELAKKFSGQEGANFVNGVLANLVQDADSVKEHRDSSEVSAEQGADHAGTHEDSNAAPAEQEAGHPRQTEQEAHHA